MARKLKSPAFQWYPRDYISSSRVTMMSLLEEAIYRKLMDYCWLDGSISADPERIQRLIGKESTIPAIKEVLKMFHVSEADPDALIHDRLEIEREKQKSNSEKRAAAANKRWDKQKESKADANAMQMHTTSNAPGMQKECLTTTIATTTTTTPTIDKKTKVFTAPSESEFVEYVVQKMPSINSEWTKGRSTRAALSRYETYIEADWKDGNGKPIKNWKTKAKNAITHEKPWSYGDDQTKQPTNGIVTTNADGKQMVGGRSVSYLTADDLQDDDGKKFDLPF
jgi:uncharacterized protein YdaU (DUF1376 family)